MVDPTVYGIKPVSVPPSMQDVYAISATHLQGIYASDELFRPLARYSGD